MKNILFILKSFRLILGFQPWKLLLLFLLTLYLGISQGFSVVLLIPFLQLLDISESQNSNRLVNFFNDIFEKTGIPLSIELILITFALLLISVALLNFFKALLQASYQQKFTYTIRKRLFRKIIYSDWSVLNSKSKHNHLQILTEEVPNLANYYFFYMKMLSSIIIVAAHLVFAFLLSVKFSIIVLAAGFISFVFMRKFLFRSYHYGEDYLSTYNRLLKYIDDFWQTVKMAKVHNSEAFYYDKFDETNRTLLKLDYKLLKNHSLPQLLYRIAGVIILVLVVYTGYKSEGMPLTSFFILIVIFGRVFPRFTGINNDLNQIFANAASVKMVLQLDNELADKIGQEQQDEGCIVPQKEIRLQDLDFSYSENTFIFKGFNETIPARKITGIIGESGIGKTTLIDIIAGLQHPKSGVVAVDGKQLTEALLPQWRNSIGYLPQEAFFIDGTLRENLLWDIERHVSDAEIWEALEMVNADALVKNQKKGLDTVLVNLQFYLSGGERQRLALARVLLRRPKVLILDEATSSLDAENERLIMEALVRLKDEVTVIFVTHRGSVRGYFDKIVDLSVC